MGDALDPPPAEPPDTAAGRADATAGPTAREATPGAPDTADEAAGRRAFPLVPYLMAAVLACCVVGAGLALVFWLPKGEDLGTVSQVRITPKPGIDLSKIEDVLDTPDYYVEVLTHGGKPGSIRTKTEEDKPVGSGLTFDLPVPLRLEDIKEVRVWDENSLGRADVIRDRTDRPARSVTGERFTFTLHGHVPEAPDVSKVGWALIGCGGVVLLLVIVRLVAAQAV